MLRCCDKRITSCVVEAYGNDMSDLYQSIKKCRETVNPEQRDESIIRLFKRSTTNLDEVVGSYFNLNLTHLSLGCKKPLLAF